MRFERKVSRAQLTLKEFILYIMNLTHNDSKDILRDKISQKCIFKTFYCNNQGTNKVKDFLKHSREEIYFTLLSNSTQYLKFL